MLGFDVGGTFWTTEGETNRATLRGIFTTELDPQIPPIPLPAAAWLLLGGLGALGAVARRRKAGAA